MGNERQAGAVVDAMVTASYDADPMTRWTSGQANLTAIAVLLGTIITAVWVWKRLSLETQDYVIDQGIPIALMAAVCLVAVFVLLPGKIIILVLMYLLRSPRCSAARPHSARSYAEEY